MKDMPVTGTSVGMPRNSSAAPSHPMAESPRRTKGFNVRDVLVALSVALVGGALILPIHNLELFASDGSIGPGWWPTVLGGTLVAGAFAVALVAFRQPEPLPEQRVNPHGLRRLGAVVTAIILYGFAWQFFHFLPVTVVFLSALMFTTGGRGVKALAVFPVLTAAVLYGLFGMLLQVPL